MNIANQAAINAIRGRAGFMGDGVLAFPPFVSTFSIFSSSATARAGNLADSRDLFSATVKKNSSWGSRLPKPNARITLLT